MTIPNHLKKLTGSLQFRFIAAFCLLLAALLLLLNSYPLMSSRDMIFKEKESAMLSRASVVSSSLAALDGLGHNNVSQVMELLDVSSVTRTVVTDPAGRVLYDTADESSVGKYALFSEIYRALDGEQVFYSRYADQVFLSRVAMPVRTGGNTTGAVYMMEVDDSAAALILSIQGRLRTISLAACAIAFALAVLFSRAITRRISQLVNAIHTVRDGDYAHRLEVDGDDELSQLAGEFNTLTERLQTTEAQRRRFVSDASHELKTPLASIRLLSDSIAQSEDMDAGTMREFVTDIGSEAERLQRTTEKLLDLSRRDDASTRPAVPVDTGAVAEATLRLLLPLAAARDVQIDCKAQPGCTVLATEDEIHQIIFNLAENAVKYNIPGGSVTLYVFRDADTVRLQVEDTGIGIPDEDMEHIFERFYRVDKARSREAGGSGLGLSIVHDAVVALGGSIRAGHGEAGGSVFTVSFPLYDGKGDAS